MDNNVESVENFFINNLDGKECFISSGGLLLESNMEQKCKLKFHKFYGLHCLSLIKNNSSNVAEVLRRTMCDNRETYPYTLFDIVMDNLIPVLNECEIKMGLISLYNVKSINTKYYDNHTEVDIVYENGSIVNIRSIK